MLKRSRILVFENYRSSRFYPHKLCYGDSDELYWCQIGSFGAITRIMNIVPKRQDLLKVAAAGPLAGFSLGLGLLLVGFFLPPADGIGVIVDASVFHESLLVGGLGKYNFVMHYFRFTVMFVYLQYWITGFSNCNSMETYLFIWFTIH